MRAPWAVGRTSARRRPCRACGSCAAGWTERRRSRGRPPARAAAPPRAAVRWRTHPHLTSIQRNGYFSPLASEDLPWAVSECVPLSRLEAVHLCPTAACMSCYSGARIFQTSSQGADFFAIFSCFLLRLAIHCPKLLMAQHSCTQLLVTLLLGAHSNRTGCQTFWTPSFYFQANLCAVKSMGNAAAAGVCIFECTSGYKGGRGARRPGHLTPFPRTKLYVMDLHQQHTFSRIHGQTQQLIGKSDANNKVRSHCL